MVATTRTCRSPTSILIAGLSEHLSPSITYLMTYCDCDLSCSTGEKPQCCPTCDFATSDPGSLTRHRKRVHGYEPKPRKARSSGKVPTTKKAFRHTPYSRDSSIESFTSSSTTSFSPADLVDLTTLPYPPPSSPPAFKFNFDTSCACATPEDEPYSYAWTKPDFANDLAVAFDITSLFPQPPRSPSPRQLLPGSEAANTLEGDEQSFWNSFDTADFGILPPLSSESAQMENGIAAPMAPVPRVAYWPQPKWDLTVPATTYSADWRVAPAFTANNTEPTFGFDQLPWSLSEFTRHMTPPSVDSFGNCSSNKYQGAPVVDWSSVFEFSRCSSDTSYSSSSASSSSASSSSPSSATSSSSPTTATFSEIEFPSHIPLPSNEQWQGFVSSYLNLFT